MKEGMTGREKLEVKGKLCPYSLRGDDWEGKERDNG